MLRNTLVAQSARRAARISTGAQAPHHQVLQYSTKFLPAVSKGALHTAPSHSQLYPNPPEIRGFRTSSGKPNGSSSSAPTSTASTTNAPASISTDEYHSLADTYIEGLLAALEEMAEVREDVDVEYSAGVLRLDFPPAGTYVINKQPPNKQIWLSSPVSGPKRYDWVISGGGDKNSSKDGDATWVYLRDGSTLNQLLEEELGIDTSKLGEELD